MTSPIRRSVRPSASATSFAAAPFALALIASLIQASAQAQTVQPPNKLDSVFVTATRSKLSLDRVLADVTVLTRADIERQAFGGLANLLRTAACFDIVQNGGPGTQTSVFLRGANTQHTLVLVDGIRMDTQSGSGGATWETIPLAQIERVEVLRGAASAVYGSDAVAGVVQIFTRKGQTQPQVELSAGFGSLNTQRLGASVSGRQGTLDYAFTLAGERSDGFNALDNPKAYGYNPDRDGWSKYNGSARLGAQLSAEHRVELMALKSHVNAQYDASAKTDDHAINDTQATRLALQSQWQPGLQTTLSASQGTAHYETKPSPYTTDTRVRSLALDGSYRIDASQQVNFIAERREDHLDNSGLTQAATVGSAQRAQNALALGYLWSAYGVDLRAHARHDQDSQFGGVDTGTLGLGWALSPAWKLVASAGNAFRAPTLYQQYSDYGPNLSKGNAPLAPERGRNSEIGLKYAQGDTEFSATAYRNLVSNLIVFGGAGSCLSAYGCYQNVADARLQGLSLAASSQFGGVQLRATLDLQAPKDLSTGNLLARRSREFGSVQALTQWQGWDLGSTVSFAGKRYDNAANTTVLGGYALVGFSAQRALSTELKLQINIDNSFDKFYETAKNYSQAPRTVFVGLRYTPKF